MGLGRPGVAVAFHPHHVDHLAPWCELLDLPLLLCDGPGQRDAARCYPNLKLAGVHDVTTPPGLARMIAAVRALRPGAVLYSHLYDRTTLRELFGAGRNSPRVVHCPHGFSENARTMRAASPNRMSHCCTGGTRLINSPRWACDRFPARSC